MRCAGVPHIKPTSNPATWMLEISTVSAEERAGADLAQVYQHSNLWQVPFPRRSRPGQASRLRQCLATSYFFSEALTIDMLGSRLVQATVLLWLSMLRSLSEHKGLALETAAQSQV